VASADPQAVVPGAHVDVLVTRDASGAGGQTRLALEDVEVLAVAPAPPGDHAQDGPRVAATLRVTLAQAVYLAAAQAYAREVRLLARPPGDRSRAGPLTVSGRL
jgi:pilus assembly protein CpaB